jgi:hypothetical protein
MSFKTIPPSVLLDFGLATTVPMDRRKATETHFILPHATELQYSSPVNSKPQSQPHLRCSQSYFFFSKQHDRISIFPANPT